MGPTVILRGDVAVVVKAGLFEMTHEKRMGIVNELRTGRCSPHHNVGAEKGAETF